MYASVGTLLLWIVIVCENQMKYHNSVVDDEKNNRTFLYGTTRRSKTISNRHSVIIFTSMKKNPRWFIIVFKRIIIHCGALPYLVLMVTFLFVFRISKVKCCSLYICIVHKWLKKISNKYWFMKCTEWVGFEDIINIITVRSNNKYVVCAERGFL